MNFFFLNRRLRNFPKKRLEKRSRVSCQLSMLFRCVVARLDANLPNIDRSFPALFCGNNVAVSLKYFSVKTNSQDSLSNNRSIGFAGLSVSTLFANGTGGVSSSLRVQFDAGLYWSRAHYRGIVSESL